MPRLNTTGRVHRYHVTNADLANKPVRHLPQPADAIDPLLNAREVRLALGSISASTLWRMTTDGKFPRPLRVSERRIGWRRSDVASWLSACQQKAA